MPASSPKSIGLGLGGHAIEDSAGSVPEEVPVGSWPEVAQDGEVGVSPAPGKPHASFGLEGLRGSGTVLSA
jgi:hypothetical protein